VNDPPVPVNVKVSNPAPGASAWLSVTILIEGTAGEKVSVVLIFGGFEL